MICIVLCCSYSGLLFFKTHIGKYKSYDDISSTFITFYINLKNGECAFVYL